MEPINRKSIRTRSIRFWGLFTLLLVFTTLPVYRFLWTAEEYDRRNGIAVGKYHETKQKIDQVHAGINDLGNQMSGINTVNLRGFKHIEQKINDRQKAVEQIIGVDSVGLFSGEAHISRSLPIIMHRKQNNISLRLDLEGLKERYILLKKTYPERYSGLR